MSTAAKRLSQKELYGPLCQKNVRSILKRELLKNFGFEQMHIIADVLIERFLAIIEQCGASKEAMKPYQTKILALDKNQRFGYQKPMNQMKLIPIIVTIITEEELQQLSDGATLRAMRPMITARILKEAYAQGGVLSFNDIAAITGMNIRAAKKAAADYRNKHPDEVLPHSGTIFDCGNTLTHKRIIIKHHLQGKLTQQIAQLTNHHPQNVDNYISCFERVRTLHEDTKTIQEICFFTNLSKHLVTEYVHIIEELKNTKNKSKSNKGNTLH